MRVRDFICLALPIAIVIAWSIYFDSLNARIDCLILQSHE